MKYYSQFGQDKWLNENIFKDKQDGFFLEIGADDGIDKSNTKLFEDLGWDGICIEPSPLRIKSLKKNRKCILENLAISNHDGTNLFLDIIGYGKGLSGIISDYSLLHRERIKKELQHPHNRGHHSVNVRVAKLDSILEKYSVLHVDFLSIDTEGNELKIIKSINFSKYSIQAILIENNYKESETEKFLTNLSYKKVKRFAVDDLYLKTNS